MSHPLLVVREAQQGVREVRRTGKEVKKTWREVRETGWEVKVDCGGQGGQVLTGWRSRVVRRANAGSPVSREQVYWGTPGSGLNSNYFNMFTRTTR